MANSQTAARDRILKLLDAASFVEIGAGISARAALDRMDGDGVVTGYGTIDGCLVYVYAQDPAVAGGSIGEMHARKISRMYKMAVDMGAPVIALVDCAGVRFDEANDSLYSFGRMFAHQSAASGVIPQFTAVFGTCGGGLAVSASMSDFVLMESGKGKLFLNSPNAVKDNYEEKCDTAGAAFQSAKTGVCDFAGTEDEVLDELRKLVSLLPQSNDEDLSYDVCNDDLNRAVAGIEKMDKAEAIKNISDDGIFAELKPEYGKCVVTGFMRLNGRTVGVVANNCSKKQICFEGAEKAAKLVNFCDAFNIPVLTLVDVDKFAQDECNERHLPKALGKLVSAYSSASVPTVTVICGHAYGTAGVAMNSKAIGADIVYAWTGAKIGLMDEDLKAGLTGESKASENSAAANAARGYVDDIFAPAETRQRVCAAFEMLFTKNVALAQRKHATI